MANYLVIRLSAIGDVAMTIPVIYSVAKENPEDTFTVLTQGFLIPLFINKPSNLEVIGINLKTTEKGIKGLLHLTKQLSQLNYDTIIDLHDALRTKTIRFLMQIKGKKIYVINKARQERRKLTRRKNKICRPLQPVIERYADVFRQAGLTFTLSFTSLFENEVSEKLFIKEKKEYWIGLAPFAKHRGKIYPIEKTEQILKALHERKDVKIFLLGGKGYEGDLLAQWASNYSKVTSIVGRYSLDQELALINQLDLLISMDSANMHFASLVNTRVISIWGATHPFAGFYGFRQSPDDAIQLSLCCRPCSAFGSKDCYRGDWACMTQLSPQFIIDKVNSILT
ncbi:MAG: glycosyltransferase family 9 protein [Tannerellaceae bacterium]|nr:glycosyltransferase family 9 protein [Tannerellaceae bacterium]